MSIISPKDTRLLHTMLRVRDLDKSLAFYCDILGMKILRRQDFSEARFTLVFIGYGTEDTTTVLELTHNWDQTDYEMGTAYGHIAIAVRSIFTICSELQANGVPITRPPGLMAHLTDQTDPPDLIAFIEDPDGYKIELIEK